MQEGNRESSAVSQSVADRRRHKRFLEEVRVRFRDIEGTESSRWGRSRDLSLGGLGLFVVDDLPVGCHLALEIHIVNETAPVLALGRVVRCEKDTDPDADKEYGIAAGVQFLWIGEEDRRNLRRLASYFREKYGETGDTSDS